ncbi:MAG: universal stress protein [Microscillaceae bacterium]|jgi:two-component system sensor histidine kinase KdpD|nr:universal stress protein [Microscillaceae bacterium]
MLSNDKDQSAEYFLDLIKKSRRGKFKIYIGMSAGVGKTFRMLQEAHAMLKSGIDVQIGFIETHNRPETHALLAGLPLIPRRKVFYKGKELEEMDLQAILNVRPEVVIVDELAHSNIPSAKNEKRWQDVLEILDAGINVISAVNIQHLESLNEEIKLITDIEVSERVPDKVLRLADEVVNIDLTADELINRLKEGKIYDQTKVELALKNFFQSDKILQLRELALKEVAQQLDNKIEREVYSRNKLKNEKILACISTNQDNAKRIIRKTARLAENNDYSKWLVLYVQTPAESADRIGLATQRHLINNLKLATELGAEVLRVKDKNIANSIFQVAQNQEVSLIVIGKPKHSLFSYLFNLGIFDQLMQKTSNTHIDLLIIS